MYDAELTNLTLFLSATLIIHVVNSGRFDTTSVAAYHEVELPASIRAYTASLLDPDNEYRFQVRLLSTGDALFRKRSFALVSHCTVPLPP